MEKIWKSGIDMVNSPFYSPLRSRSWIVLSGRINGSAGCEGFKELVLCERIPYMAVLKGQMAGIM